MDIFDYGRHGPFILAAYGASIVVLGALIAYRIRKLRNVLRDAKSKSDESQKT